MTFRLEGSRKILRQYKGSRVAVPKHFLPRRIALDDPNYLVPVQLSLVTPPQFDRAYAEYGKFGPLGPVEERWPTVIPDVDQSKYGALKALCGEVRWTIAGYDDDLCTGRIRGDREQVLEKMIRTKYPFLTADARRESISYAYFVNR